ncbi:hypothetical protein KCP73_07740 [Salmonella enterica subsp. enterica]|nr:hypothetical protein KCP73_07740 [Salmonella enterica subsp. enterica]
MNSPAALIRAPHSAHNDGGIALPAFLNDVRGEKSWMMPATKNPAGAGDYASAAGIADAITLRFLHEVTVILITISGPNLGTLNRRIRS